jgi:hypothetical protein
MTTMELVLFGLLSCGGNAGESAKMTSLTDASVRYTTPEEHYVELRRGGVRIVVVDNSALKEGPAEGHKSGYNGLALWELTDKPGNVLVPASNTFTTAHSRSTKSASSRASHP